MKKIAILLLCFAAFKTNAQNFLIGAKAGVNATNVFTSDNNLQELSPKLGFSGGLTFDFKLKNHFLLGTGVTYSQRGCRNKVIFTDNWGTPVKSRLGRFNFDYVSIPLIAGYHFGDKFFGFANVGLVSSLLLNAKITYPSYDAAPYEWNETTNLNRFDLAGTTEIGGGMKLQEKYMVFASLAYQHSFLSMSDYDIKMFNYGLTLSLGIKYSL